MKKQSNNCPIMNALNRIVPHSIRWCTPSISPEVMRVNDVYFADMSVSYHVLGNPASRSGIFGEAYSLAAKAYGADETLFSVNGTSGSNFMVIKALKKQLGEVVVLAQRNLHKSLFVACNDYQVKVQFLNPCYDEKFQIFIPNPIEEYISAIKKNPKINVVLVVNPTYEGLSLDLEKLTTEVHKTRKDIIVFVDEAWGAHFHFSKKLPKSAMNSGVDIAVQSTHKQGSGLQQTGMIHWKKKRVDSHTMKETYQELITTSSSFHLLASLDAARCLWEEKGEELIDNLVTLTNHLRDGVRKVNGVECLSFSRLKARYPQLHNFDKTKLLVNFEKTGLSAVAIAESLERDYGIIVEKYEANNILFLTPLQNTITETNATVNALGEILKRKKPVVTKKLVSLPKFPKTIVKRMEPYEINGKKQLFVKLLLAEGKIAAEEIVPYPPGIPLLAKGEEINRSHIKYLNLLRRNSRRITVLAKDEKLRKILCVCNDG